MSATGRGKGSSVWVPFEFKEKIVEFSKRYGKPQWKILLEAMSLYEATLRRPKVKEELPIVDKVLWYIEKLCMSIGALKETPSEANLEKTLKTIKQIRDRLLVDTSILERAVGDYVRQASNAPADPALRHSVLDEVTMEVNMALKSVLIEITYKYILKEEAGGVTSGESN